jgi:hypothetical protein
MKLKWHFKKTEPFYSQGKDTTRSNFSREERSEVGILVREALQNPLDIPRDDLTDPIRVSMKHLKPGQFDANYLDRIFTPEFRQRLMAASSIDLPPAPNSEVLVIEDFGTKGLIGNVQDYDADGADQNWNAFWHREGEGAKGKASNGGAGQGKITYYSHSHASTVLGLTRRSTDSRTLLMGRSSFLRDYVFTNGQKFYRASYWTTSQTEPCPEENQTEIAKFKHAFNLSRNDTDSGLSLVIPFSKGFDTREAIKCVILDFFVPIANGRLEVTVGDTVLAASNIHEYANKNFTDKEIADTGSSFSQGYRAFAQAIISSPATQCTLLNDWNKDRTIAPEFFPTGAIDILRSSLDAGETVAVTLPLKIRRKGGHQIDTSFDVYISAPADQSRNEEAFVRRDLLIGSEGHIAAGSFVQKTRSLTWIKDKDLSDFLLSAEEPTHLKWNASLARDKGEYTSPDLILRSIRQAVPRLLSVLLAGSNKRDTKSLAKFFARPTTEPTNRTGKSGTKPTQGGTTPPPPNPPRPTPKPIRIVCNSDEIRLAANKSVPLDPNQLPLRVLLELAYEGLDQDPFEAYDPFDFDTGNTSQFSIDAQGLTVIERGGNRVLLEITNADFNFSITGFDPNLRTRARATYTLTPDEPTENNKELADEALNDSVGAQNG